MNKTITIFEDFPIKISGFEDHISNLYKLRDIIGSNHFSLQADGTIQVQHFVGFFQTGKTRVQILPKIFAKSNPGLPNEDEIKPSLEYIYRLLWWSGYLKYKNLSPQFVDVSDTDLLEIFITIFIEAFIDLFRRRLFYKYEQYESNQQFIKGKLLFSETCRHNHFLKHLHFVRHDEFTINNPVNQVFKSLIYQLLCKTNSSVNKKNLAVGLTFLQDVDVITLSPVLFQKIKFDRLNNDFEPLFNLAKLFYNNAQPGLSSGSENTMSFLVPLHLLFENFVAKVLEECNDSEFTFNYHSPQYFLGEQNGKEVFQLEPDFTIMASDKIINVMDTKYKYPFDEKGNVKIKESDLYQLSTYALRYNCRFLCIIYPKFTGCPVNETLLSEYRLKTAFGDIHLKVIQIDLQEKVLSKIKDSLFNELHPSNYLYPKTDVIQHFEN